MDWCKTCAQCGTGLLSKTTVFRLLFLQTCKFSSPSHFSLCFKISFQKFVSFFVSQETHKMFHMRECMILITFVMSSHVAIAYHCYLPFQNVDKYRSDVDCLTSERTTLTDTVTSLVKEKEMMSSNVTNLEEKIQMGKKVGTIVCRLKNLVAKTWRIGWFIIK